MLKDRLIQYSKDPTNPLICENLGDEYFKIGQTAGSFTYFMKAAETYTDPFSISRCLRKCAKCFEIQGNRENSVKTLLLHAKAECIEDAKTYIELSLMYERAGDFICAYDEANLGLRVARCSLEDTAKLLFQKAVSAWWIGKEQESRDCFKKLIHYSEYLPKELYDLAQNNLIRIGVNSRSHDAIIYNRGSASFYSFDGLEKIDQSYSQALQDMFVLSQLNGKTKGTYLEIGSADPFYRNNTWLLESKFDWRGIAVDYSSDLAQSYNNNRSNQCICKDARNIDYESVCADLADEEGFIDYLQLDCEPAEITLEVLKKIPFEKYKFRVITYEHDDYIDMSRKCRYESRDYLASLGYVMKVADVCVDGTGVNSFEDWWVHKEVDIK